MISLVFFAIIYLFSKETILVNDDIVIIAISLCVVLYIQNSAKGFLDNQMNEVRQSIVNGITEVYKLMGAIFTYNNNTFRYSFTNFYSVFSFVDQISELWFYRTTAEFAYAKTMQDITF